MKPDNGNFASPLALRYIEALSGQRSEQIGGGESTKKLYEN